MIVHAWHQKTRVRVRERERTDQDSSPKSAEGYISSQSNLCDFLDSYRTWLLLDATLTLLRSLDRNLAAVWALSIWTDALHLLQVNDDMLDGRFSNIPWFKEDKLLPQDYPI
jgi:hypothetical protein